MKRILKKLEKTANKIDQLGYEELANRLDSMIKSLATIDEEEELESIPSTLNKLRQLKDTFPEGNRLNKVSPNISPEKYEQQSEPNSEDPKNIPYESERLKELRKYLPKEEEFEVPPGSLAEEDVQQSGRNLQEEYQEKIDKSLEEKHLQEEREIQERLIMGPNELIYSEKYLKNHGFIPIRDNENESSHLGSGALGDVFRAEYKGKDVAVKVTAIKQFKTEINNEAFIWKEIQKIRGNLSDKAESHLPKIYEIIEDDETGKQIIVMERLDPVEPYQLEAVWAFSKSKQQRVPRNISSLFKDPETMDKIYQFATNYNYKIMDLLPDRFQQALHKSFMSFTLPKVKSNEYINPSLLQGNLYEHLFQKTFSEMFASGEEIHPSVIDDMEEDLNAKDLKNVNRVREMLVDFSASITEYVIAYERSLFPRDYRQYSNSSLNQEIFDNMAEAGSLMSALNELANNGIQWGDLHANNILSRPGTKELVLIDVGLYNADVDKPMDSDAFKSDPKSNITGASSLIDAYNLEESEDESENSEGNYYKGLYE